MPVPHGFAYCSFKINLESGSVLSLLCPPIPKLQTNVFYENKCKTLYYDLTKLWGKEGSYQKKAIDLYRIEKYRLWKRKGKKNQDRKYG